ncbi:ribosomal subunit interface protein [Neorickettsia helminthoeca str. Oregon]|uniref:Ribosome hibernation promoting factor n=1 Tax=Neorickettsia helminthoeca str. Oregon TaxID=1286528 RepID=X5HLK2_9RICK|nr:ribosome-associated translation inhibitor RaiA [Neorickettsia helminthoeca]AHX11285.1 ribosomal subunit interface protein [Neorickettsia helminthoeca str. Oregon]
MKVIVAGHGFNLGSSLSEHITDHLSSSVEKYFSHAVSGRVSLSKVGRLFSADIVVNDGVPNKPVIKASAESSDPYLAADSAIARISAKLRRYKQKLKDHKTASRFNMKLSLHQQDYEEGGVRQLVVKEEKIELRQLSLEDAIMHMDLISAAVFVFINIESNRLSIIHREDKGDHIVLLDTNQTFKESES